MPSPFAAPQMQSRMVGIGTAGGPPQTGGQTSFAATSGWNPKDMSSGMSVLPGPGGLASIAGNVNGGLNNNSQGIRGTKFVNGGKFYAEFQLLYFNNGSYSDPGFGLANSQTVLFGSYPGTDNTSCGYTNGSWYSNGQSTITIDSINPRRGYLIYGMALNGNYVYISLNGLWYGGGVPGNGATALTGVPAGPVALYGYAANQPDSIVVITSPTLMVYGPPVGFQAWG